MVRVTVVVTLLFLTATGASAGEAVKPASDVPLHFRLEVGNRPGHIIIGWIDESKGTGKGYDRVVLDLNRNRKCETVQLAQKNLNFGRPHARFRHAGGDWFVSFGIRKREAGKDSRLTSMDWSVTRGGFHLKLAGGCVTLQTDAVKAATEPPIRLGPPFSFHPDTSTLGPDAVLLVGLQDGNECRLRRVRMKGEDRRMRARLYRGKRKVEDTRLDYG